MTYQDSAPEWIIWKPVTRSKYREIPAQWRPWLLDKGSLTQRLVELSEGAFRVQLNFFKTSCPRADESRCLRLPPRQHGLIREVTLRCCDIPVVKAHSVIPLTTLTGAEKRLSRLGNKPLGGFLFRNRTMSRGPIEVGRLVVNGCEQDAMWGRRSVFYLHGKPVLVAEYFLPALLDLAAGGSDR